MNHLYVARAEALDRRLLLSAGTRDKSFGGDGVAEIDVFPGATETVIDVTPISGGKTLALVTSPDMPTRLARLTADGQLDPTFHADGIRTVGDVGSKMWRDRYSGRIAVTRATQSIGQNGSDLPGVVMLTAGGAVDASFQTNFSLPTGSGFSDLRHVAFQSDGKLVMGTGAGLRRLNPDGTLDTSFGMNGQFPASENSFLTTALHVDELDRIFVLQSVTTGPAKVYRLLADGQPDSSFGSDGAVEVDTPSGTEYIFAFTVTGTGQPVLVAPSGSLYDIAIDGSVVSERPALDILTGAHIWPTSNGELLTSAVLPSNAHGLARVTTDFSLDQNYGRLSIAEIPLTQGQGRRIVPPVAVFADGSFVFGRRETPLQFTDELSRFERFRGGRGRARPPGDAELIGSVLHVRGTSGDDHIDVSTVAADRAVDVRVNGFSAQFDSLDVSEVVVEGFDGHDDIRLPLNVGATVDAGSGNDSVRGRNTSRTIRGGPGDDFLVGSFRADFISGGDGNDTIDGDNSDDTLLGDLGNDLILGGVGNDRLEGAGGNDSLNGGAGADRLYGQNGNDTLNGGGGNDLLFGGPSSADNIIGGAGDNDRAADDDKDSYSTVEVLLS